MNNELIKKTDKNQEVNTQPIVREKAPTEVHFRLEKDSETIINALNRNKRLNLMVVGAAFGLVFCLLVLTTYKNDLPGEIVGIVSTITGIFGACLKDAYNFEFGDRGNSLNHSRKKETNLNPESVEISDSESKDKI